MFDEEERLVYEIRMQSLADVESKITSAEEKGLEQQGRQQCISLVTRLLRQKFGLQLELDQSLTQLQALSVDKLKDLTEAIFELNDVSDLTKWLKINVGYQLKRDK